MQQLWYIIIKSLHVSDIYMPIFRSAGCVLLHMVFGTGCCGCGPKEPVCSLVHCVSRIQTNTQCTKLYTSSLGPQPQHPVLNTTCSSTQPALLKMGI